MIKKLIDTFIPLFVAIDALGILPVYFILTEGKSKNEKKVIITHSILTAFLITIVFIFIGQGVFRVLDIRVEDFMIAGGILLMILAINDILKEGDKKVSYPSDLGVVPLGTPLIAGPATLTTALVLAGTTGVIPVILSVMLNLCFAWFIFHQADRIIEILGINGSKAIAKVFGLLLAAIAVSMIRKGSLGLLELTFKT